MRLILPLLFPLNYQAWRRHHDYDVRCCGVPPPHGELTKLAAAAAAEKNTNEDEKFRIIEGSIKSSDYAKTCLFVPKLRVSTVFEALDRAKDKQFDWSICDDAEILDIQQIPASLGHVIRSVDKELPDKLSESELLDWLIKGESFFSKKYAVLTFHYGGRYGPKWEDYDGKKVAFEFTKEEDVDYVDPLVDAMDEIRMNSHPRIGDDMVQLLDVELMDRGQFLSIRNNHGIYSTYDVNDKILERFQRGAAKSDRFWADKHCHFLIYGGFPEECEGEDYC